MMAGAPLSPRSSQPSCSPLVGLLKVKASKLGSIKVVGLTLSVSLNWVTILNVINPATPARASRMAKARVTTPNTTRRRNLELTLEGAEIATARLRAIRRVPFSTFDRAGYSCPMKCRKLVMLSQPKSIVRENFLRPRRQAIGALIGDRAQPGRAAPSLGGGGCRHS